ncbi:hypothetical protein EHQ92_03225 [Leptospira biflexa]|uniref:hypothetical protein n=1 Tax=Leptospira biflexa TaxID=172 RepID=UPI00109100FB|nr:hypothetical protein [Leptospira biflexa]TGM46958.1 hypothetical protein EHQ92_03225 [Leptospira biflexa]TGM50576.1 hypothetical protein EHQ88_09860 [Leptospira biflexa]
MNQTPFILRSMIATAILLLAFSNCSKRKVKPFEPSMRFYFFQPNLELELFKDTKLPGKAIGKVNAKDNVEISAYVEVTEKDTTFTYFEAICPERLKAQCDDGKAYFPSTAKISADYLTRILGMGSAFTYAKAVGTIVGKNDYEVLNSLRQWLLSPEKIKSIDLSKVNVDIFNTALALEFPKPDDRLKVINELVLLPELIGQDSPKDPRLAAIVKRFAALREIGKDGSGLILPEGTSSPLFEDLKHQKEVMEKQLYSEFAVRANSYKGLVAQFNKFKNHYLIPEMIFQLIAKDGAYSAKGLPFQYFSLSNSSQTAMDIVKKFQPNFDPLSVVANGKLEFKENDGVFLHITQMDGSGNLGSEETLEVVSIVAEESGGSIGFRIKLKAGEVILTPLATTDYLLTSGQGFKEFLATIPKDYKEIFKTNPYEKAVVLVAAKFGEGGFNEGLGEMQYMLSTQDRYWMVYEMVRSHPNIKRDKESSGSFVRNSGSASDGTCFTDFQWRQPKGQFYVSGVYYGCNGEGGSGDSPSRDEELCFEELGSDTIYITFPASDLRSDKPRIDIELQNESTVCQYINRLVFDSKRYKGESSGE